MKKVNLQLLAETQLSKKTNGSIVGRSNTPSTVDEQVPIVGIGASIEGLEALKALVETLPNSSSISFIVVAHLNTEHERLLPELLKSCTAMVISPIESGMLVEANRVYLIPPNKRLTILDGALHLAERQTRDGHNLIINEFLTSLAYECASKAACIVLSGTGSDGAQGVKAIKSQFGMAIVQEETSAALGHTPDRVNNAGLADFVLPPTDMAQKLVRYFRPQENTTSDHIGHEHSQLNSQINGILKKIFVHSGHDFRRYKRNTLFRRMARRMQLNQTHLLTDYIALLHNTPEEVEVLSNELMIGVTSFFRDPEAYRFLSEHTFPELTADKPNDYQLRVWVPACATGEEAYSIAIALYECMLDQDFPIRLQLYATDINISAIETARKGVYPATIVDEIDSVLLTRYFSKVENGFFEIKKSIRDMVVFAPHNIITDPPFTRMDMIVCRNLFIYFEPKLQQDLLPILHYSLKEDGILFLGSSENIGQHTDLFTLENQNWKIFKARSVHDTAQPGLSLSVKHMAKRDFYGKDISLDSSNGYSEIKLLKVLLRNNNLAPCVIINLDYDVLFVYGRTEAFLETIDGEITNRNLFTMVKPCLRSGLADVLAEAVAARQISFYHDIPIDNKNEKVRLRLTVKPLLENVGESSLMIVMFEEIYSEAPASDFSIESRQIKPKESHTYQLEQELTSTREKLRNTDEELVLSTSELQSVNEHMRSKNENLQSTIEELETSSEELQSVNEESITIHANLENQLKILNLSNNDLKNLVANTKSATLFLDTELRVERYTSRAHKLFLLDTFDIAPSLRDIPNKLISVDLNKICEDVLITLATLELDVASIDNLVYCLRAMPYRGENNVIEGVILTFTDITSLTRIMESLSRTQSRYRGVFEAASDSISITDPETLIFVDFNQHAHEHLGYSYDEFKALSVSDLEARESQEALAKQMKLMVNGNSLSFDSQLKTKSGKIQSVHVEARLFYRDKRPLIISTWFDIQEILC